MTAIQNSHFTTKNMIDHESVYAPSSQETTHVSQQFADLIDRVQQVVAPVWPLKDYVAVNPYMGISERPFMDARAFMRVFSNCETLMSLEHYAQQFQSGKIGLSHIEIAISELKSNGRFCPLTIDEIMARLVSIEAKKSDLSTSEPIGKDHRCMRTISDYLSDSSEFDWSEVVRDEVSKYCAMHYDDGQSTWSSPWKSLPLYLAWRNGAQLDRGIEILGLRGFRKFVTKLPQTADAAVIFLLQRLGVPTPLWEAFLLAHAFATPGWSAWTKSHDANGDAENWSDFCGLLAIRLAYDVAISETHEFKVNWEGLIPNGSASFPSEVTDLDDDALIRSLLLRASEIAFRDNLLSSLSTQQADVVERKYVQMVFCIDVRSERIRRQIESQSQDVETFGFAGFFGMPIEMVSIGETSGKAHLPVLLKPQFKLREGISTCQSGNVDTENKVIDGRSTIRSWRKIWKGFQSSAVGCFSFVETTGLIFGLKLLSRATGWQNASRDPRFDGLAKVDRDHVTITLKSLAMQSVSLAQQTDLVESMLKNLGLTKNFARLVVFCGHGSQTENNPLAAGLDCGACGGHSGEPNARLAAELLNRSDIRQSLADRGLSIPPDTHFLAGLHNTTTDQIEFFDLHKVPESHLDDVGDLTAIVAAAGDLTREERMPIVGSQSIKDLLHRASDWSETRPEWGLAGNAAFIVGPRSLTKNAYLDGRSFLHSYDHSGDTEGSVLETIMTAPMVVAHWINMQYYASTVDNQHFGSGTKTIHNVVGGFGIFSGNGGDLMTGLPWQSLQTCENFQHVPLRLQAVIAAPRESIERIIDKHELLQNLLSNGWLHLVSVFEGNIDRYTESGNWIPVDSISCTEPQPA